MEQKLTKDLLLQYANHSSEKVRDAALNRICDELLKGDKGLLEKHDFSYRTIFRFMPERVLLQSENNDVWGNFFYIVLDAPEAFDAVLEIYRSEKTPEQMKKRCLNWLWKNEHKVPLHQCIETLLKNPDDNELMKIVAERCKSAEDPDLGWIIIEIPFEKIELKLQLINILLTYKRVEAAKDFISVLLDDLNNLSPSMAKKFSVETVRTVISAVKRVPNKFDIDLGFVNQIKLLQKKALIKAKDYIELLNVLTEGWNDVPLPLIEWLLPGLIPCLKEDKKNFALVNEILQKAFAVRDCFLLPEALYVHACIARIMKSDKDFKKNHFETFKQDLYRYAGAFKDSRSSRFEECYAIWFNLDDKCFLKLVKDRQMSDSKEVIKLLNFAADRTPQGWKKVFDTMNWEKLRDLKPVVQAVLNFVILPKYDSIRFDAIQALQQILQNRFNDEDADEIEAKLKKHDLTGIFKVLHKEDPQEIAKILNLLKEE